MDESDPHKYCGPSIRLPILSSPPRQLLSNTDVSKGPQTFPKFNELPKRLRLRIWSYLLPDSRVLELWPCSWNRKTRTYNLSCRQGIIPLLLHVSHETRHFIKSKGWQEAFQPNHWRGTPVYINFAVDCIFLSPPKDIHDGGHALGSFMFNFEVDTSDDEDVISPARKYPKTDIERIKYLTIDLSQWTNTEEETNMIKRMKSLKEFVGVVDVGEKGYFDPVIAQALTDLKHCITLSQQQKKWVPPQIRVLPYETARGIGRC